MDGDHAVSADDYRALAELRYQLRSFMRFSEQAARRVGLQPQHHEALLALRGLPEEMTPTVGLLAERLQLEHQTAVELVDRLVQRGLIERTRDTTDRRQVLLSITAAGAEILHDLAIEHRTELRATRPALVGALRALLQTPAPVPTPADIVRVTRHAMNA